MEEGGKGEGRDVTGMDKLRYVQMIARNNAVVQSSYAHHSGENVTGIMCRCVCWG